ncbi:hypothetical protein SAMN04515647_1589 [Cohaesibacter sp. ES.047]|uniref:hypothetical protein n=1 Tax=Cohaesibacter sp. ES.047 TaxID=1798205 RepID=UPI000BB8C0F2|nr:hypothetical protein [Cohaesibacter sp. ES.047]SNY91368.1 hypothetical protein SAMN04515647_1589 [Cohaesibacter sp. ES.047]
MSKDCPDQLDFFKKPVFETRFKDGPVDLDRFRARIKRAMSQAIRESGYDRRTIALRMAQHLGLEKLSKTTLDAYTAESKETHDISLVRFAAFVRATDATWLWDLILSQDGLTILEGEEPRLAEIARLQQERKSINAELRKLQVRPVQIGDWRAK